MRLGNSTSIGPAIASIGKDRQRALDSSSSDCLYRRPLGARPSPAGFNCLIVLRSLLDFLCARSAKPMASIRFECSLRPSSKSLSCASLCRFQSQHCFANEDTEDKGGTTARLPALFCHARLGKENYNPQRTGSVCLSLLWCLSSCISALAFSNSSLLLYNAASRAIPRIGRRAKSGS